MSGTSIRESKPVQQLGERKLLERAQQQVRLVERERLGDGIRDGDAEDAGRLRGADPVERVLERNRLVWLQAESAERLEVERRLRLCTLGVAVRGDDRVPGVHAIQPLQMAGDPFPRATRDDRSLEPAALRFDQVLLDAGAKILEIAELVLARAQTPGYSVAVERPADELLEMRVWVDRRADRSPDRRPFFDRQLVAVFAVPLLVG